MPDETPWWAEVQGAPPAVKQNLREIKALVGMRTLLEHYGARVPGLHSMGWIPMQCPFHKDSHASGSLNEKLGRFNCFTCDYAGDIFDIVEAVEHLDTGESIAWIQRKFLMSE